MRYRTHGVAAGYDDSTLRAGMCPKGRISSEWKLRLKVKGSLWRRGDGKGDGLILCFISCYKLLSQILDGAYSKSSIPSVKPMGPELF